MRIVRCAAFEKKLARLPRRLRAAVAARTALFVENQRHPLLNDHALTGTFEGRRSFNITGDWRLVYRPLSDGIVFFLDIDTHHNLYGT